MLDEASLRADGFTEGVRVVLDDGQAWSFPRPTMRFPEGAYEYPAVVGPDGAPGVGPGRSRTGGSDFGADYDRKVEALLDADDADDERRALVALAYDLLARNYRLGPAEFCTLWVFRYGDPGNEDARRAVCEVALGRAPKPTPSGSAPPA